MGLRISEIPATIKWGKERTEGGIRKKISILLNPIIPLTTAKVLDALNIKTKNRNLSFLEGSNILPEKIKIENQ